MSYIQPENSLFAFTAFDFVTKRPLFSKHNFNFCLYAYDFLPTLDPITSKSKIFSDFLLRNNASLDAPFVVRDDLKKYFTPMTNDIELYINKYGYSLHSNYMYIEPPDEYVVFDELVANQFDLVWYTDSEFRRLQDYIVKYNEKIYSKYNFLFDIYSNDMKVWGSKLLIFTDFTVRSIYLNNLIVGSFGYGFPPLDWKKYFYQDNSLNSYINTNGIVSIYKNTDKNVDNIDWIAYNNANGDLSVFGGDKTLLIDHYYTYGQFEIRTVPLLDQSTPLSKVTKGIVTVVSDGTECSGFLIDGSASFGSEYVGLYLITCYHLIEKKSNKNFMTASVIFNTPDNNSKTITRQLQFSIIGYDIYADVCVGYYDSTTSYNQIYNSDVNINNINKIDLGLDIKLNKGDEVTVIGNLDKDNDLSVLKTCIDDSDYIGSFETNFYLGMPDSLQLNILPTLGLSGSPILIADKLDNTKYVCVGMINASCGYNNNFTLGIKCFLLHLIISNIIGYTAVYKKLFTSDIIKYNFVIRDAFPKKWLGIKASYYHVSLSPAKYPTLLNFPYNGGIVVHDIIIGFNPITSKFVYDVLELSKQSVVKLNTPLIGSKMYNKFISSSKNPLIIKSINVYNNINGIYNKFDMGKYGDQTPYNLITYQMSQIGTMLNDLKYVNKSKRIYGTIDIEYYYYNGLEWILDIDTIGGTSDDWYYEISDGMGNLFKIHRFDFPPILIPYITFYHKQFSKNDSLTVPGIVRAPSSNVELRTLELRMSDPLASSESVPLGVPSLVRP
jgi:hypothetical protein